MFELFHSNPFQFSYRYEVLITCNVQSQLDQTDPLPTTNANSSVGLKGKCSCKKHDGETILDAATRNNKKHWSSTPFGCNQIVLRHMTQRITFWGCHSADRESNCPKISNFSAREPAVSQWASGERRRFAVMPTKNDFLLQLRCAMLRLDRYGSVVREMPKYRRLPL